MCHCLHSTTIGIYAAVRHKSLPMRADDIDGGSDEHSHISADEATAQTSKQVRLRCIHEPQLLCMILGVCIHGKQSHIHGNRLK